MHFLSTRDFMRIIITLKFLNFVLIDIMANTSFTHNSKLRAVKVIQQLAFTVL